MRLSKTQMIGGAAAATLLIAIPLLMRPDPIEVETRRRDDRAARCDRRR